MFFAELGFPNFSKALRLLDCWLESGTGNSTLLERIQSSRFAISEERLTAALAETSAILQERLNKETRQEEEYAGKSFRPYIEVIPELSRPTQITLYGLTGGNSRFNTRLPDDISTWPLESQLSHVKTKVVENFAAHNGRTYFRGRIKGYFYHPSFDEPPVRLAIDGDIDTSHSEDSYAKNETEVTLTLGRRKISGNPLGAMLGIKNQD